MAAVRHIGFVVRLFGPLTKSIWWSVTLQNFVGINACSRSNLTTRKTK